jgi:amino-acid N-acetyltransferase
VPSLFKQFGFDVVDKDFLPMKVWNDCQACLHRENCDEIAMTLPLVPLKNGDLKDIPLPNSNILLS